MGIFDDIINGNGITIQESNEEVFTEAVYPESVPYLKMMKRKITLPKGTPIGRGNLCFLYTNNTKESIEIMNTKTNFLSGNSYYYYYYNPIYIGKLYNRKYRIREVEERKVLYKKIDKETKLHPYLKLSVAPNENRNMYFDLSRYLSIFFSICGKLPPLKKINFYWSFIKPILSQENFSGYTKRFVLVDIDKFKLTKNLKENLNNPLYMIYYTMFRKPELLEEVDIDFYFYTGNRVLKINPSKTEKDTYKTVKIEMKKLYSFVSKELITTIMDENQLRKEEAVEETVDKLKSQLETKEPEELESVKKKEEPKTPQEKEIEKRIETKVNSIRKEIDVITPDVKDISQDTLNNALQARAENDIDSDKELISAIYDNSIAKNLPKKSFSTERDRKLKEEQKNLKVGNMTIQEIEKIKTKKIDVPVHDVSNSVQTVNKNMTKLKFDNFEKTYNEKLMPKDITDAILSLNNKSIPMYVRKVEVTDTSDELNYKDTYTVYLEDANRKRHTIKVDIPKFIDDRFLYIGGNKKIIKKQNFLYPVVKTNSDTVQIVTNYNKMFVRRVGTKSISSIERLKILLKKSDEFKSYFTFGSTLSANTKHITTIEYDELSKIAITFKNKKCQIFFDQNMAKDTAAKKDIKIPKDHMFIGFDSSGNPVFINDDTQKTKDGKTIVEVILDSLSKEIQDQYTEIKGPAKLMYAKVTVMAKDVSIGLLLGFWEGLDSLLKKANITYRLENTPPKELKPTEGILRFADTCLIYESNPKADLLLNGFRLMDIKKYNIMEMNNQEAYLQYLIKVYGRAAISNALMNVYEFMIDPITEEVLKDLNLPTDLVELVIYAVSLLSDSQYTPEINQNLSRIRSNEVIPAILYERLAKNYITYRNSNGKKKFSVPRDCVIKEILALKTVEDYSTLNPILELEMAHGISSKGFRGVNLDDSYTLEKRSYDPTMVGIMSPSTSPDGSCGVNRTLTMEPSITNLRGYVDTKNENLDELKDVNLFSPGELSIPLGAHRDDPTRLGFCFNYAWLRR